MAPARNAARNRRSHDADGTEHAPHDVVDARASAQRIAGPSGHVGQAAHHLHHLVQRQSVFIRPGQKAFVADIDQPFIGILEAGIVQAVLGQGARLEVLYHHVDRSAQPRRHRLSTALVQIERQAFLVAVEQRKKPRAGPEQLPSAITAQGLHLDHFGTKIGQDHAAGRPHDHVAKFDHPQTAQGQCRRRIGHGRLGRGGRSTLKWRLRMSAMFSKQEP